MYLPIESDVTTGSIDVDSLRSSDADETGATVGAALAHTDVDPVGGRAIRANLIAHG